MQVDPEAMAFAPQNDAPLRAEPIGQTQGFSGGRLYRLGFADMGAPRRPLPPLIAKLAPREAGQRAFMAPLNAAERLFYQDHAQGLPVPRFYGAAGEETGESALLIEDLGALKQVPFVQGLSAVQMGAVVDALAAVHARHWQAPHLGDLTGAALLHQLDGQAALAAYPAARDALLPEAGQMSGAARLAALLAYLSQAAPEVCARLWDQGPLTLVHRDCQPDNLFFDATGAARLIDWQFMGRGRAGIDLGAALIAGLTPQTRRAEEAALVARYHAALIAGGVRGYGPETLWHDVRAGAAAKLLITAVATLRFDASSPARRAWRAADLARLAAFVEDHRLTPETLMAAPPP